MIGAMESRRVRCMLVMRDGVLPMVDAASRLAASPAAAAGGTEATHAVVVRGSSRYALTVDRLVGQRELVTRPLPAAVAGSAAVSGGAVLSDGRIALIVDCDAVDPTGAGHAPRIAA